MTEVRQLHSYLYGAARNIALNTLKRVAASSRRENLYAIRQERSENNIESLLSRHENQKIIQDALHILPAQQRAVFTRYLESYSYDEISRELNISKHTVRNHVMKSKKLVRVFLKGLAPHLRLSTLLPLFMFAQAATGRL